MSKFLKQMLIKEILNLENIVKDYAKQSLGEELTDEQYMWNEKVKGSRDKGTPAERVQMILDQLNALRPNVVSTSGGKRTNLTVKKNNHLHNVMGMDPGMYYNLSQESTISYVPVSIPVELFGQEWKKSPSWAPIDTESVVQTRDIQRGYRIDEDGNKIPARDALLAGRINASTLDKFVFPNSINGVIHHLFELVCFSTTNQKVDFIFCQNENRNVTFKLYQSFCVFCASSCFIGRCPVFGIEKTDRAKRRRK